MRISRATTLFFVTLFFLSGIAPALGQSDYETFLNRLNAHRKNQEEAYRAKSARYRDKAYRQLVAKIDDATTKAKRNGAKLQALQEQAYRDYYETRTRLDRQEAQALKNIRQDYFRQLNGYWKKKEAQKPKKPAYKYLETIPVGADGRIYLSQNRLLRSSEYYLFVTGTFQYDQGEAGTRADACHFEDDNHKWLPRSWLTINGRPYRPDKSMPKKHQYAFKVTGNDSQIRLRIVDEGYNDNAGALEAKLYLIE